MRRLVAWGLALALIVALRVAGLNSRTLALGGAFTAVILGLAAQQTLEFCDAELARRTPVKAVAVKKPKVAKAAKAAKVAETAE